MISKEAEIYLTNEESDNAYLPHIGFVVTADIRLTRNISSSNLKCPKCSGATSSSGVAKESSSSVAEINVTTVTTNETLKEKLHTEHVIEVFEHPVVRKSKKHTQLNNNSLTKDVLAKKAQINRLVLLPRLGCTTRYESLKFHKTVLTKSSKSWETFKQQKQFKNLRPFYSVGVLNVPIKSKNIGQDDNCMSNEGECYWKRPSSRENEKPTNYYQTIQGPSRSFYLIENSSSEATFSIDEKKNANFTATQTKEKSIFPDQYDLLKNITGFEDGISPPLPVLCSRTTRNVSILHRPKTRDKATSTTSLNRITAEQKNHDNLIKGLFMPFTATGKDFPSELILQLIPKKEAISSLQDNSDGGVRATNSSELNLLAPTLNAITIPKKKKKKGFLNCFSSNDADDKSNGDYNSTNNSNKEVYFPSVVEVHNKRTRKTLKDTDSDIDSFDDNFYHEGKKKK